MKMQKLVGRDHIFQQARGHAWGQNVLHMKIPVLSRSLFPSNQDCAVTRTTDHGRPQATSVPYLHQLLGPRVSSFSILSPHRTNVAGGRLHSLTGFGSPAKASSKCLFFHMLLYKYGLFRTLSIEKQIQKQQQETWIQLGL